MENRSEWTVKLALACCFSLVGGILMGALITELVLLTMRIDPVDLPFPIALISLPVNETIILGVTLLFARYKGASFKDLGLKKASLRILIIVSVLAVPLFLLGVGISMSEEMFFGPDPVGKTYYKSVVPRDPLQLVAMVALSLILVGPCEESAFRGFVQRGLENSFGKMKGLLFASALFGLLHGLNTLYAIVPTLVAGLVLGYVWQQTSGNSTASALTHGINNSISMIVAYFLTI